MFRNKNKEEVLNFDKEIMKKEILAKYERNKIQKYFKWTLIPICLIVVIGVIIFINSKNDNNLLKNNHKLLENASFGDNENNNLYINDLTEVYLTSLDDVKIVSNVCIPYPFKVNEEKEELFIIPSDLTQTKNYVIYTKDNKDSNDYNVIASYVMLISDGSTRNIEITYAKDKVPLRDYSFNKEESKTTIINGITMNIYKYKEKFYVIFSYNGYNFDIETSNITEKELADYLNSIIR